jgi:hypothetical protein
LRFPPLTYAQLRNGKNAELKPQSRWRGLRKKILDLHSHVPPTTFTGLEAVTAVMNCKHRTLLSLSRFVRNSATNEWISDFLQTGGWQTLDNVSCFLMRAKYVYICVSVVCFFGFLLLCFLWYCRYSPSAFLCQMSIHLIRQSLLAREVFILFIFILFIFIYVFILLFIFILFIYLFLFYLFIYEFM